VDWFHADAAQPVRLLAAVQALPVGDPWRPPHGCGRDAPLASRRRAGGLQAADVTCAPAAALPAPGWRSVSLPPRTATGRFRSDHDAVADDDFSLAVNGAHSAMR
jgi:hypothetical protein